MAVYTFKPVPAWGAVGQFARIGSAKSKAFPVTVPAGTPATVVQGGVTKVGYVESDSNGLIPQFTTTDIPSVVIDMGVGPVTVHSLEAITAGAASAAAAANSASDAAASAASVSAASTAIANKTDKGTLMYYAGDYASPQACLDAAPAGAIVKLNAATINTALSITKAVSIIGGGNRNTVITANGCDGFVVANGVGDVSIENLAIAQSTRYTTTTNTFVGVKILGDATHRPSVHTYRDLYIDGFETGIQANYLWTSRFDNVQTAFGLIGLDVYGLSENNTVTGGNLVVGVGSQTRLAGSACIQLNGQVSRADTTPLVSEGWVISGTLMYGGDFGVNAPGYGNYQIVNCILDAIQICGVRIIHNGTAYGGNALIQGNYIAMATTSTTVVGAIEVANTVTGARGSRIVDNDVIAYVGSSAPYGIHLVASTGAAGCVIKGNVTSGFNTNDILVECSGNAITQNRCTSSVTDQIKTPTGQFNLTSDNLGAVFVGGTSFPNTYTVAAGGAKWLRGTAAPTALAWKVGDRVVNSVPTVGQPKAWICTVAGTPGTWVSEGNL